MEEYNNNIEQLIKENQLMAGYILKLEEQIKDLKSYAVLYNTQRKKAEHKLKNIQEDLNNIMDITYEDGN
jgi:hypothetical protein